MKIYAVKKSYGIYEDYHETRQYFLRKEAAETYLVNYNAQLDKDKYKATECLNCAEINCAVLPCFKEKKIDGKTVGCANEIDLGGLSETYPASTEEINVEE